MGAGKMGITAARRRCLGRPTMAAESRRLRFRCRQMALITGESVPQAVKAFRG